MSFLQGNIVHVFEHDLKRLQRDSAELSKIHTERIRNMVDADKLARANRKAWDKAVARDRTSQDIK